MRGLIIRNNLSYDPGAYFVENTSQWKYNWPDTYGQGFINNNLVYSPGGGGRTFCYNPTKNWTISGNIEGKDPMFVNHGAYDFHLQPGSPAIDHGDGAAVPSYDFERIRRPQGNGYDIGAYEFVPDQ